MRQLWIEKRAYQLWQLAGEPKGHDLEFWIKAEVEHDHAYKGKLCVLAPDNCPYQVSQPTTGGRHVSLCTRHGHCHNRAINFNE